MSKAKKVFMRIVAVVLCVIIVNGFSYVSAFVSSIGETNPITNEQIAEALQGAQFIDPSQDSAFVLAHSDVQTSDVDYFPETADIQKADEYAASINSESVIMPMAAGDPLVGDVQVCMVQKWLNQEYRSKTGATLLTENGRTSSYITNALTRALQYEMGMTSWSDAWGPNTGNLYLQNILSRQDGVTDNKFAILQAALWCKGYSPGYYFNYNEITGVVSVNAVFNENVENAVIRLKQDMGLSNTDGTVTLNVMKALMSMDDFKRVSGGDTKVREMQQKLNRKYEPYFTNPAILPRLSPCDGIYSANTNRSLIYAFQAEEGLPVGVANGSYGNTTRNCTPRIPYDGVAKSYTGSTYTSSQIAAFTELFQFALYVNGFDTGAINGVYNAKTQQAIRDFQKEHALPVTGKADLGTWMSLFISCGDRDRSAIAADCATILTAQKAQALYNAGYRYVGRYLTGTYGGGISKALTREEIQHICDAGLRFWPIYQTTARENAYFTPAQGTEDAKKAIAATAALGIPRGTIIYFAVDFDAMDYQVTSNIIPYFQKVHEEMSKGIYKTGIYGARNICSRVSALGYACSSFVGNISTGFSGNIGYSMPSNWAFNQFTDRDVAGNYIKVNSADGAFEIDKNGFSGRDLGVGKVDPAVEVNITGSSFNGGSTDSDTLYGPTVDILGHQVPLFYFEVGFTFPNGFMVESEYNSVDQELEVIIGVDLLQYSQNTYGIREKPTGEKYRKAFKEVESMVSLFGKTNKNPTKQYPHFKGSFYDKGLKLGIDANATFIGYMKFSLASGKPILTSGEMGITADAKMGVNYPIITAVSARFEIEGSLEAGFKLIRKQTGVVDLGGHLKFELEPRLGVYANIYIADAYAGIGGKLECELEFPVASFRENFEAELSANFFFEYDAFKWGSRKVWTFAQTKLYPRDPTPRTLSISTDNLKLIEPLPKAKTRLLSATEVYQENMQVYAKPKIINLGNGNLFMTYIDDSDGRTSENSTILMYSVYNGASWTNPQPVSDDGTADFEPVICSDGSGGAHILWQNAITTFGAEVNLEEMSARVDLSYIHWNGNTFDNVSAITNSNLNLEANHKIVSSGDDIAVVWKQNSENDPFGLTGSNSIHRKQYVSGSWQTTEILASDLSVVTSIDTSYVDSDNVVAYSAKNSSGPSTVNDLEVYYVNNSQTTRLTDDDDVDLSVSFLDNELYWISDNSIVSISDGDINSKEIILEDLETGISKIKAIGNESGNKSIIWEHENDSVMTFYATNYDSVTGLFETAEPLTTNNGVVRGWDACFQSNGQIELAYCYADYLDEPVNDIPYGALNLIQKPVNKFYNVAVDPIAICEGEILVGEETVLFADVYNSGSQPVTQFEASVFDENDNLVQTLTVDQSLAVGESSQLEIPFILPSVISRTDYRIQILPIGGDDIFLSDNEAIFSIGFADLVVENVQEVRNGAARQITATVKNRGFDTIDAAELNLNLLAENSDGEMLPLDSEGVTNIAPGAEVTLTFELDENNLDATVSEDPRLFYLSLETEHEESDYSNNSATVTVYPDYPVSLTAATGGIVTGTGLYEHNSRASIAAIPEPGYLFEGWYEDGKLLAGLPQICDLAVNWGRTLEARFKSTDLAISGIEVTGILEARKSMTITAHVDGGAVPYKWSFYVYYNGTLHRSKLNSDMNVFTCAPSWGGEYTVSVVAEDETGYTVLEEMQITVAPGLPFFTINRDKTLSLSGEIPADTGISYWYSDNEKVAKVDGNGVVSGNRTGTAIITAVAYNGQRFSYEIKVDFTWWQVLLMFLGIGMFFLPFWIA